MMFTGALSLALAGAAVPALVAGLAVLRFRCGDLGIDLLIERALPWLRMDSEELLALKALTDICESMLAFQVAQVKFVEAVQLRFQNLEKGLKQSVQILALPDVPERKPLIEQFVSLHESLSAAYAGPGLLDALARLQTDQERLESYVAQLRAFLRSRDVG